jgi:hypothetical protein
MQQRNMSLPRWHHATVGELREAVLPHGPAPGRQCHCNGTRETTPPTSTEEWCFLLGLLRGYITLGLVSGVQLLSGMEWSELVGGLWDRQQPTRTWSWGIYGIGSRYQTTSEHTIDWVRRLSMCCSKVQSVWIINNTIVTCSYDL